MMHDNFHGDRPDRPVAIVQTGDRDGQVWTHCRFGDCKRDAVWALSYRFCGDEYGVCWMVCGEHLVDVSAAVDAAGRCSQAAA